MSNKKISPGEKEVIIERLKRGISIEEIAEEFRVSERTIRNIKNEMPPNEELSEGEKIKAMLCDYNIKDKTKYQEFSLERVKREMEMFSDPEEGWIWKTTEQGNQNREAGQWWWGVCYPESAPDGWIQRLEMQGFNVAVSPIHDKDSWNHDSPAVVDKKTGEIIREKGEIYHVGDKKKAHWHFIVTSDKVGRWKEINRIVQGITHGPMVQKLRSLKNGYEYFLHRNHPNKYQGYFADEIYKSPNFHIEASKYEKGLIFQEICKYIKENEIDSRLTLIEVFGNDPEYVTQLKSGSFISGLLSENWLLHNPNGRTRNICIIKDERRDK